MAFGDDWIKSIGNSFNQLWRGVLLALVFLVLLVWLLGFVAWSHDDAAERSHVRNLEELEQTWRREYEAEKKGKSSSVPQLQAEVSDILARLERLEKAAGFRTKCIGCGTEFVSGKPSKDVATCPNCPLSDKEFEELKKQALEISK